MLKQKLGNVGFFSRKDRKNVQLSEVFCFHAICSNMLEDICLWVPVFTFSVVTGPKVAATFAFPPVVAALLLCGIDQLSVYKCSSHLKEDH